MRALNDEALRDRFICDALKGQSIQVGQPEGILDWSKYFKGTLRNAIAHAVRRPGRPVLDPDDLTDRQHLDRASGILVELVRRRVSERWPDGVRIV